MTSARTVNNKYSYAVTSFIDVYIVRFGRPLGLSVALSMCSVTHSPLECCFHDTHPWNCIPQTDVVLHADNLNLYRQFLHRNHF